MDIRKYFVPGTRFGLSGAWNKKNFQAASSDFTTQQILSPNECSALQQCGQQGGDCPTARRMPRGRQGGHKRQNSRGRTHACIRGIISFVKLKLTSLAPGISRFVEPSQSRSLKASPSARLLRPSKGGRQRVCASLCPSRMERAEHAPCPANRINIAPKSSRECKATQDI